MLNTEDVIKKFAEVKEFCDNQCFCQKCPFYDKESDEFMCQIVSKIITNIDGHAMSPTDWELEDVEIN